MPTLIRKKIEEGSTIIFFSFSRMHQGDS